MSPRTWALQFDDNQLKTLIGQMRETGNTYREIASFLKVNVSTLWRWEDRRKPKFNVQQALSDFASRLQSLEENLVRGFTPPPPPPSAPLRADGNGPSKPMGTQIHNGKLLQELKEVNALFARIKEESKNW